MAIDPLNIWKEEFANLPKVTDNSWVSNISNHINDRVTGKLKLIGYFPEEKNTFTLNTAILESFLTQVNPEQSNLVQKLAEGLEAAILDPPTLVVLPGSYIGSDTPTTKFSVVTASVIDSASTDLMKVKLSELLNAPLVNDASESQFPIKIREAFLLLTAIIVGVNSVTPTPGPMLDVARGVE